MATHSENIKLNYTKMNSILQKIFETKRMSIHMAYFSPDGLNKSTVYSSRTVPDPCRRIKHTAGVRNISLNSVIPGCQRHQRW